MSNELNTLLTALYVFIDDHVVSPRTGRGRRPLLSDSELITLAVAQVLMGFDCERQWIRYLHATPTWRAMFPYLPGQSGYHKRLKAAEPLLCTAIRALATACPSWFDDLWITDATAVPCGASRQTVKRSDLAGHAGYGYCASHSRFYWGLKLYLVCAGDGMPIMWCLANPKIGEREVVAALLDHNHRLIRAGQVLLADKGFAGKAFKQHTDGLRIRLLRPDRRDEAYRNGSLGQVRQWDRVGQSDAEGPARAGTARWAYPGGGVHPGRAASAGHGRGHLAQLGHWHGQQAIADRLRPLTHMSTESTI